MIGMTVVDAWKIDRLVNADALTIKEYGDIMGNDMMKAQEITDNGWFKNKTHIYNDFKYNMFLHELKNKHVERYDLRENQQADSYIFKVTNAR